MAVNSEPLLISDLDKVMELEPQLFDHPFEKTVYLFELNHNPYAHYLKLQENNELIGYGGIHCIFDESHLITIGISNQHQQKGLGRKLLEQLIDIAKQQDCTCMFLEVAVTNYKAIQLYESMEFKKLRTRKEYYGNVDAYEMKKEWRNHNE